MTELLKTIQAVVGLVTKLLPGRKKKQQTPSEAKAQRHGTASGAAARDASRRAGPAKPRD